MTRPSFSTNIFGSGGFWNDDVLQSSWSAPHLRASESVIGVSRRKPSGWVPPTSYNFRRVYIQEPYGVLGFESYPPPHKEETRGLVLSDWLNACSDLYEPPNGHDDSLENRALIKARLKMKNMDVNLGQAFAERDMTARLVGDSCRTIAKSYTALRRGNLKGALSALGLSKRRIRSGSLTDRWLELQYGWKPLLSDIFGAADALSKRSYRDWRVTAKGSATENVDASGYWRYTSTENYPGFCSVRGKKRALVRIDSIPANELAITMASVGITNPALIAWELVPASFIVDWFIPVGDYLSSLDAMLGYDSSSTWSSTTTSYKVRYDYDFIKSKKASVTNFWCDVGDTHMVVTGVHRSALQGVALPSHPYVKDPRSLLHMANGLSLLVSAFR